MSGSMSLPAFYRPEFTAPDVPGALLRWEQARAAQAGAADRAALREALASGAEGLASDDPAAQRNALLGLARTGVTGANVALPRLDRLREREEFGRLLGGIFGGAPAQAPGGKPEAAPSGSFVDRLVAMESGNRADARNPNSSATGAAQFIDSTWMEFARENPELFRGMSPDQILAARNHPGLSRMAAQWYADKNRGALSEAGLPTDDGAVALAHRFGPQGAQALLSASPQTPIASVVGDQVMRANPDLAGKTVGDVVGQYRQRFGGGDGAAAAGNGFDVTPQALFRLAMSGNPQAMELARTLGPLARQQAQTQIVETGDGIMLVDKATGQTIRRIGSPVDRRTNVTTNVGGERAWDQENAKLMAKRYDDITSGADNARQMLAMYDLGEQALNTGVRTGIGGETELRLRQFGAALGLDTDPSKLAGGELIRAVQNRMALTMRSPSGGMGMPGALSDRDIQFLRDSQIGIDRSPEGNRRMLAAFRAMEMRKIEIARLADEYVQEHGRLDAGFNKAVREYAEANPLFPERGQQPAGIAIPGPTPGSTAEPPAAPDPLEGRTATGPNGQRIIRRGGQWVPMQ